MTKLIYNTEQGFYDGLLALTERGLTFTADPNTLTITLTGGY